MLRVISHKVSILLPAGPCQAPVAPSAPHFNYTCLHLHLHYTRPLCTVRIVQAVKCGSAARVSMHACGYSTACVHPGYSPDWRDGSGGLSANTGHAMVCEKTTKLTQMHHGSVPKTRKQTNRAKRFVQGLLCLQLPGGGAPPLCPSTCPFQPSAACWIAVTWWPWWRYRVHGSSWQQWMVMVVTHGGHAWWSHMVVTHGGHAWWSRMVVTHGGHACASTVEGRSSKPRWGEG